MYALNLRRLFGTEVQRQIFLFIPPSATTLVSWEVMYYITISLYHLHLWVDLKCSCEVHWKSVACALEVDILDITSRKLITIHFLCHGGNTCTNYYATKRQTKLLKTEACTLARTENIHQRIRFLRLCPSGMLKYNKEMSCVAWKTTDVFSHCYKGDTGILRNNSQTGDNLITEKLRAKHDAKPIPRLLFKSVISVFGVRHGCGRSII